MSSHQRTFDPEAEQSRYRRDSYAADSTANAIVRSEDMPFAPRGSESVHSASYGSSNRVLDAVLGEDPGVETSAVGDRQSGFAAQLLTRDDIQHCIPDTIDIIPAFVRAHPGGDITQDSKPERARDEQRILLCDRDDEDLISAQGYDSMSAARRPEELQSRRPDGLQQQRSVWDERNSSHPRIELEEAAYTGGSSSSSVPAQSQGTRRKETLPLMLRNLPTTMTSAEIMKDIDESGFAGCYDMFYLPAATSNDVSRGFAFINFNTPEFAERFAAVWHLSRRYGNSHRQAINVVSAKVQGRRANYKWLQRAHAFRTHDARFMPFFF